MLKSVVIAASTLLLGATVAVPPGFLRSDAPALGAAMIQRGPWRIDSFSRC